MAKLGRPEKPIDWDKVDKLIIAQNTLEEIAGQFNMDRTNFSDRIMKKYGMNFTTYASSLYCKGRSNIRLMQYNKAMDGNIRMLERLGDIYLNQREKEAVLNSPNQENLDKDHQIMELQHKINQLEAQIADKRKTE